MTSAQPSPTSRNARPHREFFLATASAAPPCWLRLREVETAVLIATLGSPYQPTHASHFFADALRELETCGVATLTLSNRSFTVTSRVRR